jgi:predicted nucleotidyltransferase
MTREETLSCLRTASAALRREFGVVRIGLFGSLARGEAGPESDVDLLVEFDAPLSYFDLARLEGRVAALVGRRVDITPKSHLPTDMLARIEKDLVPA